MSATGEKDGKTFWKEVGVFWKNDKADSKSIGTINIYYPQATFHVFPPNEDRQPDKQREPKW